MKRIEAKEWFSAMSSEELCRTLAVSPDTSDEELCLIASAMGEEQQQNGQPVLVQGILPFLRQLREDVK